MAAADGSTNGIYFFNRSTMAWLVLPVAVILGMLWLVAGFDLTKLSYSPERPAPCHGSKCMEKDFLVGIVGLFLLLPVWVKLSAVGAVVGEALSRLIANLVWSFDKKPDFTIGPEGVYGPSGLQFHHVPWTEISCLVKRVYVTPIGLMFGLSFETSRQVRSFGLFSFGRKKPLVLKLQPIHGLPLQEIVDKVRVSAPHLLIKTEEKDWYTLG